MFGVLTWLTFDEYALDGRRHDHDDPKR